MHSLKINIYKINIGSLRHIIQMRYFFSAASFNSLRRDERRDSNSNS